jgi:thiol-disulfide isomerase/thioredoxin
MVIARNRFPSLLAQVAVATALAALACGLQAQVAPGNPFPSLATAGLTGGTLPETAGHVLFVDFWASWCAPCKASFPAYSQLQADYASRGLVIVAVSVDENPALYSAFVAKLKPTFATLIDGKHTLVQEVQVPTMPTSYLVDRSGKVRFMHAGFHGQQTERELRREIDELLGERPSAP